LGDEVSELIRILEQISLATLIVRSINDDGYHEWVSVGLGLGLRRLEGLLGDYMGTLPVPCVSLAHVQTLVKDLD